MDFRKLLVKIAKILDKLNIPYLITGGYAVSVWGRPRSTLDVDAIIELPKTKIKPLVKTLRDFSKTGYIDELAVEEAVGKKQEFNFIHSDSGIKIDFWVLKEDNAFELLKFKRRTFRIISRQKVYFISPEDLILSKLQWYLKTESSRQLEDVESILKISGKKLDQKYLKNWARKLKVLGILNKVIRNLV